MGKHHIVLTGLSGSGKSTCGRLLASMLGLQFVDLDARVAEVAGRSVDSIFKTFGEAHFRALESDTLKAVLELPESIVIATGGGALVDDTNRSRALAVGHVVWLRVSADEATRRTAGESGRPLLADGDAETVLQQLIAQRTEAYACADIQLDTDGRTPESVADDIRDALLS